jgi:opacity protein-like surface antigen
MKAMKLFKYFLGCCLLIGMSAGWGSFVRAEVFVDLYGGLAKTEDDKVEGDVSNVPFLGIGPITNEKFKADVKFKDSFTVGMRGGYWLESYPWFGGAIDGSYYAANAKNVDIDIPVGALSFLFMLRYPLFTNDFYPKGRLQPYMGIGPELAVSYISADFDSNGKNEIEELAIGLGLDLRGGMVWKMTRNWGIFLEYRFTHVKLDANGDEDNTVFGGVEVEDIETTLSTHHFLGGLSYRF